MSSADDREDLAPHLRDEPAPEDATVVIRGGPDTREKLESHARRTARAFALDGVPVLGISVFAALDDIGPASLDALLRERMATYRVVHLPTVAALRAAGMTLLPTFKRPHYTAVLADLELVADVLKALGPEHQNPYHSRR